MYFWEAGLGMRWSDLIWMIIRFLRSGTVLRRFLVLCGSCFFIPLMHFLLVLWGLVSVFDSGWVEYFGDKGFNLLFFILVVSNNDSSIKFRGCF
jgi:voltage-gated potassium channel Kch